MEPAIAKLAEAVQFVRGRLDLRPTLGVLTGTGLGNCVRSMDVLGALAYGEIPHFPTSTVQGHPGSLLLGRIGACETVVMHGRFHLYEGYSPREVTFPIRVMQSLGVETLVVTNAAGGLNPAFSPGGIMVISDHINLTGSNPLTGPNIERWGPRFPDMGRAYPPELISAAEAAGSRIGARMCKGVYAGLHGPSLETPAEVRFLRVAGADAVGFSTVQEVLAAVHAGMKVLGLSTITNVHNPDHPAPTHVEDVIAVARAAAPQLEGILLEMASICAGDRPR
jgi:purine-nucleoside phosphorylase